MDQIKIGKFISERRRAVGLTQMQLAERLGITDRAVSKWETGRAMPDASIMLELCAILSISVNDLLSGEAAGADGKADMNERVVELVREKQESDKRLLASEWVIAALSLVILFVPIAIAMLVPMEEWVRTAVAFSGFIPAIAGLLLALRIEQRAGYYECAVCKHRYIPKYWAVYLAPHISRTRYMRCPACNKRSWQKKVISREKEE